MPLRWLDGQAGARLRQFAEASIGEAEQAIFAALDRGDLVRARQLQIFRRAVIGALGQHDVNRATPVPNPRGSPVRSSRRSPPRLGTGHDPAP